MSIFDKSLKNVAEIAAKIMSEQLKGNQHKIDVAEPKGKITGEDLKKLRDMKKEDVEQVDEIFGMFKKPSATPNFDAARKRAAERAAGKKEPAKPENPWDETRASMKRGANESLDQMENMIDSLIQEYESKGGVYKHKGTYGYSGKGAEHGQSDHNEKEQDEDKPKKPARGKYGARQNYVRSSRVNESFTELLSKYVEGGVKSLNESLYVEAEELTEEPDNEQFTKEVETAKKKDKGEMRNDKGVAAAAVQSVSVQKEEVEQIDEISISLARRAQAAAGNKSQAIDKEVGRLDDQGKKKEAYAKIDQRSKVDAQERRFKGYADRKDPRPEVSGPAKAAAADRARRMAGTTNEEVEQVEEAMSHQAKTTMKHIPNPTAGEKKAAKDIKPGVAGYRDRIAMLQSAEARGALKKEEMSPDEINGVSVETIEERSLTEPETKEKERLVKSMKKNLAGFKKRYGERGKSVMYATATKNAKENA